MPRNEERAASEVIGAVLVFGFLVVTFAIYQGVVIPQQNRSVEFEHNQAAQVALQDLRNAIRQTATAGAEASVSVALGASYPQRILGQNPGVSAGTIRTEPLGVATVGNVTATDPEVADYFGNTTATLGPFQTKAIAYRPLYTHYSGAPNTVYENSLAYNQFPSGVNLSITDQALVDGRKITLIALTGNVSSAQQGSVTVDTQAVSTATNTVSITNETGPINLTIATELTAADWRDLLADEIDPTGTEGDKFVSSVQQTGPQQVSIVLEPGVTYELKLAQVGVGEASPSTEPKYIADVDGDDTSLTEGGNRQLVVEVRDRFNNPISNVTVDANLTTSAGGGDSVSPSSATTDAQGRATFTYQAPGNVDTLRVADVEVSFDGDGTANETVTFDVRVLDADSSGQIKHWRPNDTATTLAQRGPILKGIGNASHINISNPKFVSIDRQDGVVSSDERFRIIFVLERDGTDNADGETRYLFALPESVNALSEDITSSGVDVSNGPITIYRDDALNTDNSGYDVVVTAELKSTYMNEWYRGNRTIDLLANDTYIQSAGGNVDTLSSTEANELQNIIDFIRAHDDIDLYFHDMHGRVTVSVE